MPDWFYRTLTRPALFRLPPQRSRDIALGFMGRLASLPWGTGERIIDLLGHMRPDPRLRLSVFGQRVASPIGLGPRVDPAGRAARAWAQFGFGFIEMGPVLTGSDAPARVDLRRLAPDEAIWISDPGESFDAGELSRRLKPGPRDGPLVIVRLKTDAGALPQGAAAGLAARATSLSGIAHVFALELPQAKNWSEPEWHAFWAALGEGEKSPDRARPSTWLLVVPADASGDLTAGQWSTVERGLVAGLMVEGSVAADGGRLHGRPAKQAALDRVRSLRRVVGPHLPIVASGGIHQPADAVEFLDAGATLIQIDTGLIYSGPGLAKRINEALHWRQDDNSAASAAASPAESIVARRPAECSWFWTLLLGVAMLMGGLLALIIASHRVVLPYDEAFCGWTRQQIQRFNPRLLSFLSHDRVTLAGTMLSTAVMYLSLSWNGSRLGLHWARLAVLVSAGAGFCSFFLFLGFGYFEPFHGFVTVVLFQLFALGVHAKERPQCASDPPDWTETSAWRRGQWGQLLLVVHSIGLLVTGIIIANVGVRDVLVAEDSRYLGISAENLRRANPHLIPLIAHDRATLGGMLVASGLVFLLATLWGWRRGARWLWHAFFWSGLSAYAAALGVHFAVGYVDFRHLLPAFAGLGLWLGGLALTYSWTHQNP